MSPAHPRTEPGLPGRRYLPPRGGRLAVRCIHALCPDADERGDLCCADCASHRCLDRCWDDPAGCKCSARQTPAQRRAAQ